MLLIHCPYCDEQRSEEEFTYAGEAHVARPADPLQMSDRAWGEYLFFHRNPKGLHHEQWYHAAGCRRYFNVTRHTVSYAITQSYRMGEQPEPEE